MLFSFDYKSLLKIDSVLFISVSKFTFLTSKNIDEFNLIKRKYFKLYFGW